MNNNNTIHVAVQTSNDSHCSNYPKSPDYQYLHAYPPTLLKPIHALHTNYYPVTKYNPSKKNTMNVIQSNCSPSYQVHCIATTAPNNSSQSVDQTTEGNVCFHFGEQL